MKSNVSLDWAAFSFAPTIRKNFLSVIRKTSGHCAGWEYGAMFRWRDFDQPDRKGMTVRSQFKRDTVYFGDSNQDSMLNYRVENFDLVLTQLRDEGVWVDDKREDSDFGKFGWIKDRDGNRVELGEPPKENPD